MQIGHIRPIFGQYYGVPVLLGVHQIGQAELRHQDRYPARWGDVRAGDSSAGAGSGGYAGPAGADS